MVLLLSLPLSAQQKGTTIVNTNNNNRSGRMALVIGNGNYEGQGKLRNPGNDADAMSKALQELGFKVWTAKNLTLRRMDSLIDVWGNRIKDYEVSLFYFSGHGAEAAGENYLFPIDATPSTESDAKYECYPVNKLVGKMNSARTLTNILLLDACRNNPFQRSWQRDAGGSGLANMEVPRGMFFGFSTSPGRTADDGSGNNSPYVSSLVKRIKECNTSIYDIFTEVNNDVQQLTNQRQVPYVSGTLNGRFYFCNTTAASAPVTNPTNTSPPATSTTTPPPAYDDAPAAKNLPAPIQKLINDMVYVPGGTFTMGCTAEQGSDCEDDEKPAHRVTVSSFKIGKYEVTVAQFEAFVKATGYVTDAERLGTSWIYTGKRWEEKSGINWLYNAEGKLYSESEKGVYPVIHVSWNDADAFCKWLSKETGKRFRLPTEAEWEYAARGGGNLIKYAWGSGSPTTSKGGNLADETGKRKFNWTDSPDNIFQGYDDGYATTSPVGLFGSNTLGLYDMTGNVWEWCADWYDKNYYESSPMENPKGPASGLYRVVRGGSWGNYPRDCRVANRGRYAPDSRLDGFRIAQD